MSTSGPPILYQYPMTGEVESSPEQQLLSQINTFKGLMDKIDKADEKVKKEVAEVISAIRKLQEQYTFTLETQLPNHKTIKLAIEEASGKNTDQGAILKEIFSTKSVAKLSS